MADAETLLALAGRAEQATGPDDALFEAAFWACNPNYADIRAFRAFLDAGAWLDAAMSLVPPYLTPTIIGHDREVRLYNGVGLKVRGDDYESHASTLALALVAAALRARSRASTISETGNAG